mgnify:FL=1
MKTLFFICLFLPFATQSGTIPTKPQTELSARGEILKRISNKKVSTFFNRIWNDAVFVSKEYKIPLALVLSQAAQESGWGTSKNCRLNNNYFGVRSYGEYHVYSCQYESFVDYAANVLGSKCYKGCNSLDEWFYRIECCYYASDNGYVKRLKQIIKQYNLNLLCE